VPATTFLGLVVALQASPGGATAPAGPSRADTLEAGATAIRADRIPLGTQTVRSWQVSGEERTLNSTTVQTIRKGTEGTEDVLVIETLHWSAGGDTTRTRCTVRADDLSLLHLRVQAERDSTAVTATSHRATGWVALPGQPVRLLDATLARPILPSDGQIPWLLAALPLRAGATLVVKRFSPFDGGEICRTLRVEAEEAITIAGTRFDCWRIDGGPLGPPGYRVTRWVDRATGRIVQSALRGAAGGRQWWSEEVAH
jgi:hypothetical protein